MSDLFKLAYFLLSFIGFFSTTQAVALENTVFNGWTHLELGAGNYGCDGHTKSSQAMTVLMKIEHISKEHNYIDDLEEYGRGNYRPEEQYGILFSTLDELVDRYGEVGVFHVNDLYEEYANFATQRLKEYAMTKGYHSLIIEAIPEDYQWIDPKKTLSKYGKEKYSSAHLKNPEVSFYYDCMDGNSFSASSQSREKARDTLQNLANLSESGLYLFILYHKNFIPPEEVTEFIEKNIFYHATQDWKPVPYIFPEGNIIDKNVGRVFHIKKRSH